MLLSRNATITFLAIGALALAAIIWFALSLRTTRQQPPAAVSAGQAPALPPTVDLVGRATIALQSCSLPSPPASPDGATASLNQMLAARNAFQAYDAATNGYVSCVDNTVQRIVRESAGQASKADVNSLQLFGVRAHNTAIDQETAYVDQFNAQLRTYKAKHPKF